MDSAPATRPSTAQVDASAPIDGYVTIRPESGGLKLHLLEWPGEGAPFVLLHGLASNARTWLGVGNALAAAGYHVFAVDQRGHGLSDKASDGYDFATICDDLLLLLDTLALEQPIVVGQSWGGNVVLEFAARNPGRARGFAFIDGGILDLQEHPSGADWESIAVALRPPNLIGTPRSAIKQMIAQSNPGWTDAGVEATLANFETLPDGTVRPWLTLEHHMRILRSLWEQRPGDLYPRVAEPVLICAADDGNSAWTVAKHRMVASAQAYLPTSEVRWFHDTAHDIHVHRPSELASIFINEAAHGIWSGENAA